MTYVLHPTSLFNSPGVVRWALHAERSDHGFAVQFLAALFAESPGGPEEGLNIAKAIIDGTASVTYDDDAGTVTVELAIGDN